MDHLNTFQIVALILIFVGLPILIAWWMLYALWYHKHNVNELIASTGWEHELVKRGTVERRFRGNTDDINWVIEFKIPRSQSGTAQLTLPSVLEWRTSDAKLMKGVVAIVTIPPVKKDVTEYAVDHVMGNLDIQLKSELASHPIGSPGFQHRYIVMADEEESAQQVSNAAENRLLQWPEWKRPDLYFIPTPVLLADTKGISIRISLNGLGLQSRVHAKEDKPFLKRVYAIVQLGVEVATRLRGAG